MQVLIRQKLSEKQRRNLGILSESKIEESLELLGLPPEKIDYVLMTHMHHDHSGGLTQASSRAILFLKQNARLLSNDENGTR